MKKILLFLSTLGALANGQTVTLDVNFLPYVTYYVSSIDLNTGSSNVPIFYADLCLNNCSPPYNDSVNVIIDFKIIIDSDDLGLDNQTLVWVKTDPFKLQIPIHLNNQDLTIDTDQLFDEQGNPVPIRVYIEEKIETSQAEDMFNAVVQSGRLPDGVYRFAIKVWDESNQDVLAQYEEVLNVTTPTYLQLISPGGTLADTTINEIYTTYPLFQWESDPCNVGGGCQYFIRVAEFNPGIHSTVEEAIESITRLPLDQALGYAEVGWEMTSFQYPVTGAGDLEPGKVYVWQVKKEILTTTGTDEVLSEIFAFKVKDFSTTTGGTSGGGGGAGATTNPTMTTLQTLLGDDQFNALFGAGGNYAGYSATGTITLDDSTADLSLVQSLITQGIPETDSLGNVTYRPINIISVEVEE